MTVISIFMFIGATGKSAQLILHSADKTFVLVKILAWCISVYYKIFWLLKSLQSACVFFFTFDVLNENDWSLYFFKLRLIEFVCIWKAIFWRLKSIINVLQLIIKLQWYWSSVRFLDSFGSWKYTKYQFKAACTTVIIQNDSVKSRKKGSLKNLCFNNEMVPKVWLSNINDIVRHASLC